MLINIHHIYKSHIDKYFMGNNFLINEKSGIVLHFCKLSFKPVLVEYN